MWHWVYDEWVGRLCNNIQSDSEEEATLDAEALGIIMAFLLLGLHFNEMKSTAFFNLTWLLYIYIYIILYYTSISIPYSYRYRVKFITVCLHVMM